MEDFEEEDESVDDEAKDDLSFDEEEDDDDPKDKAFLKGVEQAEQIEEKETEEE